MNQCWNRWQYALDPGIARVTERKDKWLTEESDKLVAAVRKHNGKNWDAPAYHVRGPGPDPPTSPLWNGSSSRASAWHPTIAQAATLTGLIGIYYPMPWTPSSTGQQSWTTAEVDIDSTTETTERKGKWTTVEDEKLRCVAEMFAGTRWRTIATLIPGRTKKQCWNRWHYTLDPNIVQMTECKGKWLTDEDDKLVAAVRKYDGKNWDAIAWLVPTRTKRQCMDRWHKVLVEDNSVC